jgi:hypothetical protein
LDGGGKLLEMRHDLGGEHFHVVDLPVEVAGFRAKPNFALFFVQPFEIVELRPKT